MWEQLITFLKANNAGVGWVIVITILSGIIEISPIKLNPWSKIKSFFSIPKRIEDTFNRVDGIGKKVDVMETERKKDNQIIAESFEKVNEKIDTINEKVENMEKDITLIQGERAEERAMAARLRILNFGEKIMNHQLQTEEYFKQILRDIDEYERYCWEHPAFQNNITVMNSQAIKEVYKKCMTGEDGYHFLYYAEEKGE